MSMAAGTLAQTYEGAHTRAHMHAQVLYPLTQPGIGRADAITCGSEVLALDTSTSEVLALDTFCVVGTAISHVLGVCVRALV